MSDSIYGPRDETPDPETSCDQCCHPWAEHSEILGCEHVYEATETTAADDCRCYKWTPPHPGNTDNEPTCREEL